MKKCPKCGTILDDNKKRCYMCGADLTKKNTSSFAENFDKKIGAQTSSSQDNIFNNNIKMEEPKISDNKNVFYSNNSSAGFFNNTSNNNQKNAPINNQIKVSENRKKENESVDPTIMNFFEKNREYENKIEEKPVQNKKPKKQEKIPKEKPIKKENTSENIKVNFNVVFNILCFIVFLGIVILGYFKIIKPKFDNKPVELNKLSFVMDKEMKLTQSDKNSKYYTRGESCAIKISYGETNDVDGFTDSYFEQIRTEYVNDHNHLTKSDEIKINDNKWSSLSILELTPNPAASGGFSTLTKYKYISIVKDGNYYNIVYANTENDSTCSKIFEDFTNTLDFK